MSRATVPPGVAAGHPATAAAGLEILSDGGGAADAAVAATLASGVAETVMTGLAGGGHALYWDAGGGQAHLIDCFVAVPGLDGEPARGQPVEVDIVFGEQTVRYAIGAGSVGVPGVPAGCDTLWRRWGRLPWARLVEPALRLSRDGVPLPPRHADGLVMVAPAMTHGDGAGIYAPTGRLLRAGELLRQPGLTQALALLRDEGADTFYTGSVAAALLRLMRERGGAVTGADLRAYRARCSRPAPEARFAGLRVASRRGLSGLLETLPHLPVLADATPGERALAFARTLRGTDGAGDTTNVVTVDGPGNACVFTTSLGLGSGDFLPGLDLHLNSMLGETDLLRGPLDPGTRLDSMMAPTVVLDDGGLVLATGAAGGSRIRSALVQTLSGVLVEGLAPAAAVERPRLHPAGTADGPVPVHAEAGLEKSALDALDAAGYEVRRWSGRHHYFGGVSLVARDGAAGDSRRDGAALLLRG